MSDVESSARAHSHYNGGLLLWVKRLYVLRLHTYAHKSEKGVTHMKSEVAEVVRERVSITLPKECIEWIDGKVETRIYANRSHAIEVIILEAMREQGKRS